MHHVVFVFDLLPSHCGFVFVLVVEVYVDVFGEEFFKVVVVHEVDADGAFTEDFAGFFAHFGSAATYEGAVVSFGLVDEEGIKH